MKKIIALALLTFSLSSFAGHAPYTNKSGYLDKNWNIVDGNKTDYKTVKSIIDHNSRIIITGVPSAPKDGYIGYSGNVVIIDYNAFQSMIKLIKNKR